MPNTSEINSIIQEIVFIFKEMTHFTMIKGKLNQSRHLIPNITPIRHSPIQFTPKKDLSDNYSCHCYWLLYFCSCVTVSTTG